jgi:hypothetical protein
MKICSPQQRQCSPRLRQAAGTLYVSSESVVEKVSRPEKEVRKTTAPKIKYNPKTLLKKYPVLKK